RTLTISGGAAATVVSVANPTGDAADQYVWYNLDTEINTDVDRPAIFGLPCDGGNGSHLPTKPAAFIPESCATLFGTANGSLIVSAFRGPLVVGAGNTTMPFVGATTTLAAAPVGAKTTATLKLKASQITLATKNPFYWTYGGFTGPDIVASGSAPYMSLSNFSNTPFNSYDQSLIAGVPSNYSSTNPNIALDTWNPWGLGVSNFAACSVSTYDCQTLPAKKPLAISTIFHDPGTSSSYYGWKASGGSAIAYNSSCYTLTPNASRTISITTKVATYLGFDQYLYFGFTDCASGGYPANGTTVAVTATAANGIVYSGLAGGTEDYYLYMNTYLPVTPITSLTITIHVASGSPAQIGLGEIYN
ncbi:MAG TPA: hypothetical protein VMH02_10985, partial [Verrucomicrobiae bacterium]|nr:hypothetical protein [Verrucomicrobiae bacterium]